MSGRSASTGIDPLPGAGLFALALTGGATADTLRGAGGADVLHGHGGDDVLLGEGGDDSLYGGAGNDRLEGGDGADSLDGEDGDDTLLGGAGNDSLYDSWGNNTLSGGEGDDRLEAASNGRNMLYGDAGNDVLIASRGSGLLDGGAGNDQFFISSYSSLDGPQTIEARGGDGNDTFETALGAGAALTVLLSGGSGSDTFIAQTRAPGGAGTVTVTDFATGPGGDLIDISRVALATSGNPFATGSSSAAAGSMRLEQRGLDTVVQARAALVATSPWEDVLVLRNVDKNLLTPLHFAFGFNPDGSAAGQSILGTAGADRYLGGWLDDRIDGGAGNDTLYGSMGNDRLSGGDGDDQLDGDRVEVRPGSYTPWSAERTGNDVLDGGAGNDTLVTSWGNDTLLGGAGHDLLVVAASSLPVPAGTHSTLDGGDGNDRIEVHAGGMAAPSLTISGGSGSDTFAFNAPPQQGTWTITDFQAGAGGDVLDIFEILGWTRQSPFAAGYFRLEQRGADTVVQYDGDGSNAAADFVDLVTLKNLSANALTAANMRYGYAPGASTPALGTPVTGGAAADWLRGGPLSDQLDGAEGNDTLLGGPGNDLLHGGAGLDTALFAGARAHYALQSLYDLNLYVADLRGGANDGKDWLIDVERLVFADGAIALDTGFDAVAGRAYRIYRAAFDRTPDEGGLGYWIAAMDGGMALLDVARHFVGSQEFKDQYGLAPSNAEIVTRLYHNILDRAPEQAGFDFWLGALDSKAVDLPALLAEFSESGENRTAVAELIAQGVAYQPFGG
jgi:Ca2+-binding RTX toxin-like protein